MHQLLINKPEVRWLLGPNTSSHDLEHDLFLRNIKTKRTRFLIVPTLQVDKVECVIWNDQVMAIFHIPCDVLTVIWKGVWPTYCLETVDQVRLVTVYQIVLH